MERRRLFVKMDDIIDAMDTRREVGPGSHFVLDLQSGEVEVAMDEEMTGEKPDIDWSDGERYAEIPETRSRDEYQAMEGFAESVDEEDVREGLRLALAGKGAFGRFRDVLRGYPDLLARWRRDKQQRLAAAAVDWLRGLGIEPQYELREIPLVQPAGRPDAQTGQPRIGLFDMLLLGAPEGKTELLGGRVPRVLVARDAAQARKVFARLARELTEHHGLAWRNRLIEGRDQYQIGRAQLSIEGRTVHLDVEVAPEIWALFSG